MVPDIHMENNDIGSLPIYPSTKINSNWIDDLNVTMDILNSKETWGKIMWLGLGNNFSDMTPK